jgi:IS30 family transposase
MHKMSSAMNKKSTLNPNPETILKARDPVNLRTNKAENVTVIDIEKENRLSRIISLYSKGFTQSEIAQKLDVDQSTISRDLQFIKQEAKRTIEKYLNEDILFEYLRYIAGSNEVTRHLWELVQNEENAKDKMAYAIHNTLRDLEMMIG